jgi:hypothetical protein
MTEAGVYAALLDQPVLVPVRAAVVTEHTAARTGLRAEQEAELSLLTVGLDGGRQVLPVFSSAAAMRRWRIEARPVQVPVREACRSVLEEGWTGLVVDPGRHDFVVGHAAVLALADGFAPVGGAESMALGSVAARDLLPAEPVAAPEEVTAALRRAIAREPAVAAAWLLRIEPGLEIGLVLRTALDGAGLATVAARLEGRLAERLGRKSLSVAALDPGTAEAAAQRCLRLWP